MQTEKQKNGAAQKKWREANKEKVKATHKKWREANKEKVKAHKRAWYAKNKEKVNAASKKWRDCNKDKISECRKQYDSSLSPEKKELLRAGGTTRAKKRSRERKIRAVAFLGGQCVSCGLVDCPAVYDFHHRDPSTKGGSLAKFFQRTWSKSTEAELQKCDLLCANCHRKFHYSDDE